MALPQILRQFPQEQTIADKFSAPLNNLKVHIKGSENSPCWVHVCWDAISTLVGKEIY